MFNADPSVLQIPRIWKDIPMKKIITLLLCAAMLLTLVACGSKESKETTPADTEAGTDAATAPTAAATETATQPAAPDTSADIIQLINTEDVAVHITGVENNEHTGMQLRIQCENKTDRTLLFSWDMVSVCGFMYDPFWAEEVAAGKTVNSTIELDTFALEQMDITSVDEISFTLRIVDSENWMEAPLIEEAFTIYPTGLNADTLVLPNRAPTDGQMVIADDDNLRFVIEWADEQDTSAYTLHVYLENKTDRNLMYAWDLVSVNDKMIDPFWAVSVAAGKKACSEISFYRSDLEDNSIETVENVEFTLIVSDYDDWDVPNLLEETYTYQP